MVRTPCCEKSGLKKGTWTAEEDKKLIAYVTMYGHRNWRQLPKFAGLARCGKSCRLRWMNYLRPGIKRGNYTREEEDTIIKLHSRLGNRWSMIASHLQGRSDNEIKNHWHSHLKKRVQQCSVTNQKAEACKSKYESPVESFQEKNSVEVVGTFQNRSLPTNFHTPHVHAHASPSSHHTSSTDFLCTMTEPAPASNGNSVVDDIANFLEKSADLICAYSWKELYDISYFSGEFLVPFVTEPQSFCPIYDVWGLSEY